MAAIADGIADNLTDTVRCGVQRIFLIAVYLRNTGSPRHLDNGGLRSVDDAIRADNLLSGRTGHRNGDKPSAKTFGQCLNGTFTAIGKRAHNRLHLRIDTINPGGGRCSSLQRGKASFKRINCNHNFHHFSPDFKYFSIRHSCTFVFLS